MVSFNLCYCVPGSTFLLQLSTSQRSRIVTSEISSITTLHLYTLHHVRDPLAHLCAHFPVLATIQLLDSLSGVK